MEQTGALGVRAPARRTLVAGALAVAFLALGAIGLARYLDGYWLYRGFPAPHDPAFVHVQGRALHLSVASAALGGRHQQVYVYLPPGYGDGGRRYPVLYLLHGFPGRPAAVLETVRAGVVEDMLLARHRMQPLILVMPMGSTGTFTDKEWANGVRPHERWATFVARDLVHYVDSHFRTIPSGAARALAGLSEGGYGSLNIGLQHPGEFRVLESWSGYQLADDLRPIFGGRESLLRANSPALVLPRAARALRRARTYVWLYTGSGDRLRAQNEAFAHQLGSFGIAHRFFVLHGGHDWSLWRGQAANALLAVSGHLGA
jgi:enterochelin esterase-like enzyme